MPQLNPAPWFPLLLLIWATLLLLMTKITRHNKHRTPGHPPTAAHSTTWPWPWH
uniref:ATP synthase complex subunit 8 n=1 Tax=Bipes canaliculatus TaxID=273521 RepID=Q66SD3_BIPCA|nr:ATP synthase F0 subunit 8 [Bipes canaliculatus]